MMGEFPPLFSSPNELFPDGDAEKRYAAMGRLFSEKYHQPPSFFARAPGRVNIIGEHIDYCGYAVFPMAIEQDIVFAVSTNTSGVYKMSNTSTLFNDYETDAKDFNISGHQWNDYVLCGHKAIVEAAELSSPIGMNVLVDGTVPQSAGLSSSSALVCCSGLATMQANGKQLNKLTLADSCTRCEKHVGIEGGGMDQAISFFAQRGTAKLIEFNPLKATDAQLPNGACFVIANSLQDMSKAENAGEYYNMRVSECRLAAQLISCKFGHDWRTTRRLVDTQNILQKTLQEMLVVVEESLHKEPYTRDEICKELGINDGELISECLNPTTAEARSFKLYNRAKHVYSEANRVLMFKKICDEGKADSLELLGKLMNESQESCAEDYECSSPGLDELTKICREAGAIGSRLTGAGWGGCTVSMVPANHVQAFMSQVKSRFYDVDERRSAKVEHALFSTKPGPGAAVITM